MPSGFEFFRARNGVMSWSAQVATWTANNRYPGIFRTVQARVSQVRGPGCSQGRLKILSFGCSTGSEISTLRSYFPEAAIYGCDINAAALRQASESLLMDEAVLFRSSPENIGRYGPFDVVFAMSVLCRFPDSMDPGVLSLTHKYSLENFRSIISVLLQSLKDGGMLCLYNTNYSFTDLPAASGFRAVTSPLIAGNGFVDRFDPEGARVTWCEQIGPYYVHKLRAAADLNLTDCIFEKAADGAEVFVNVGRDVAPDPPGRAEMFRFGPDLGHCAGAGLTGTALGYWFGDDADGPRIVRAWHRTTPSGEIEQGRAWSVQSELGAKDLLSLRTEFDLEDGRSAADRGRGRGIARLLKRAGRRLAAR